MPADDYFDAADLEQAPPLLRGRHHFRVAPSSGWTIAFTRNLRSFDYQPEPVGGMGGGAYDLYHDTRFAAHVVN